MGDVDESKLSPPSKYFNSKEGGVFEEIPLTNFDLPPPPPELLDRTTETKETKIRKQGKKSTRDKDKKLKKSKSINSIDRELTDNDLNIHAPDFSEPKKKKKKKKLKSLDDSDNSAFDYLSDSLESGTIKTGRKKSKNKRSDDYYLNEILSSPRSPKSEGSEMYYTTPTYLPNVQRALPVLSPYATLPVPMPNHVGVTPMYLNQNMGTMPAGGYYNLVPPALSYAPGNPYGPTTYANNPEKIKEKAIDFEVILKGVIVFIMINSLILLSIAVVIGFSPIFKKVEDPDGVETSLILKFENREYLWIFDMKLFFIFLGIAAIVVGVMGLAFFKVDCKLGAVLTYAALLLFIIITIPIVITKDVSFGREMEYPPYDFCQRNCFWTYKCTKNETHKAVFDKYLPAPDEPEKFCWIGRFQADNLTERLVYFRKLVEEKKVNCSQRCQMPQGFITV